MDRRAVVLCAVGLMGFAQPTSAAPAELTWYGQSAFKLVTPTGKVLLVDPWLVNPANPRGKQDLEALDRVDLVLVTHAHGDHVGNAVEIARKTGARLVASSDLVRALVHFGTTAGQTGTPQEFRAALKALGLEPVMRRVEVGETLVWNGAGGHS